MTLSIVIPVYNAASYLQTCVESLRHFASMSQICMEIILVDDGSTDGSGVLCDQLGDKVIHQQNQGVSVARNAGLALAAGEWIWFVDADDYVENVDADLNVGIRKDVVKNENSDFVVTGFVWEEHGKVDCFGASTNEIPYNLWRCWFKQDQIEKHGIRFTVGRKYAEDQEFILKYLLSIKNYKTAALPQIQYHYTLRPGSAITKKGVKLKKCSDIAAVICAIFGKALITGNLMNAWVLHELKRMIKTLIVQMRS